MFHEENVRDKVALFQGTYSLKVKRIFFNVIFAIFHIIYDLHFQLDEILNVITLGKQSIISPQIINHQQFMEAYKTILEDRFLHQNVHETNFQFILDISTLKLWTTNTKSFLPILEDQEWNIQKVYPIPREKQGVFMAPLIESPLYMLTHDLFINLNEDYFSKNYRDTANLYICKRNQPTHSKLSIHDYPTEIINHSNDKIKVVKICTYILFSIRELTFVPLYTENHYIVIPEKSIPIWTYFATKKNLSI